MDDPRLFQIRDWRCSLHVYVLVCANICLFVYVRKCAMSLLSSVSIQAGGHFAIRMRDVFAMSH